MRKVKYLIRRGRHPIFALLLEMLAERINPKGGDRNLFAACAPRRMLNSKRLKLPETILWGLRRFSYLLFNPLRDFSKALPESSHLYQVRI